MPLERGKHTIASLICYLKPTLAEVKTKVENRSLLEFIRFSGTVIPLEELKTMPNLLEDSKTRDLFGYHCVDAEGDGTCGKVRAFYYDHKTKTFYLFGKELNSQYNNYSEFRKGWNWSNETKKIKHDLFLSTLERFTKI